MDAPVYVYVCARARLCVYLYEWVVEERRRSWPRVTKGCKRGSFVAAKRESGTPTRRKEVSEGEGMERRAGGLFENVVYERIANEKRASENQISEKSAVAEPFSSLSLFSRLSQNHLSEYACTLANLREREGKVSFPVKKPLELRRCEYTCHPVE